MEYFINNIIRPKIQGDGGEIRFVSDDGNTVTVILQGECSKCQILDRCLLWIEIEAEKNLNRKITINGVRKKPFFWDT